MRVTGTLPPGQHPAWTEQRRRFESDHGRSLPLVVAIGDTAAAPALAVAALLREAALSAMRRDINTAAVSAADVEEARSRIRPSLDAAQVENLRAYAQRRVE